MTPIQQAREFVLENAFNPVLASDRIDEKTRNVICEDCRQPAPFNRRKDGTPYLEVHHRIPLAENGEDTVENAAAFCPNCHRKAHYG